jgi:4'-phosphopantetheinyl transferase
MMRWRRHGSISVKEAPSHGKEKSLKGTQHNREQVIAILKQGRAGLATAELYRRHRIGQQTSYWWKAKCGGYSLANVSTAWGTPPFVLSASASEVHVWRIWSDRNTLAAVSGYLSMAEDERANRFRSQPDRTEFVVARGSLRAILSRYLRTQPQRVPLIQAQNGKPALASGQAVSSIRFNLSHSYGLILLSVTLYEEVGIDVEFIRADSTVSDVAARFFSPAENLFLSKLPTPERQRGFYQCWTRKEAFLKAVGEGLSDNLSQFEILSSVRRGARKVSGFPAICEKWSVIDLNAGEGFAAALAIKDGRHTVKYWDWVP